MPVKCHTKNSSWQTTSRGRPLPSEKPMAYRNSHVVRAASKMADLRRVYSNKLKHKGKAREFWQTSTSKHQLQASQDKEKPVTKCRHLTVGKLGVFRPPGFFHFCIVRSELPNQWQAWVASYQHHRSQTDKPEPTSDAQECAGRARTHLWRKSGAKAEVTGKSGQCRKRVTWAHT